MEHQKTTYIIKVKNEKLTNNIMVQQKKHIYLYIYIQTTSKQLQTNNK